MTGGLKLKHSDGALPKNNTIHVCIQSAIHQDIKLSILTVYDGLLP